MKLNSHSQLLPATRPQSLPETVPLHADEPRGSSPQPVGHLALLFSNNYTGFVQDYRAFTKMGYVKRGGLHYNVLHTQHVQRRFSTYLGREANRGRGREK